MKSKLLAAVAAATACLVASVGAGTAHAAVTYSFSGFGGQIGFTFVSDDYITSQRSFTFTDDPFCISQSLVCTAVFFPPDLAGYFEDTLAIETLAPGGFASQSFFYFATGAFSAPGVYADAFFGDGRGRMTVSGAPTVPEPSTWALLIGGFGLAGAALRRRQSATA